MIEFAVKNFGPRHLSFKLLYTKANPNEIHDDLHIISIIYWQRIATYYRKAIVFRELVQRYFEDSPVLKNP